MSRPFAFSAAALCLCLTLLPDALRAENPSLSAAATMEMMEAIETQVKQDPSDEPDARHGGNAVRVRCDRGRTIQQVLRSSREPLVINFSGRCTESVVINRDRVTLRGIGADPTIDGSVSIQQAHQITLENFTIVDSPISGVEVFNGSTANLQRLTVVDSALRGINIRNSTASLADLTVRGSGLGGLIIRGSRTNWTGGVIDTSDNDLIGISVTDTSSAFIKETAIISNNNPTGVSVQLSSTFALLDDASLVTNNNNFAGIFVATYGAFVYANSTVESRDNDFLGVWVEQKGTFSPFSGLAPPTALTGNGLAGVLAEKDSLVELTEGTVITGNLFGGLLVDNSSINLTGVTIVDNAAVDLSMRFGSTAIFLGPDNEIGEPIQCDDSVLTQGDLGCPTAASVATSALEFSSPRRPPS